MGTDSYTTTMSIGSEARIARGRSPIRRTGTLLFVDGRRLIFGFDRSSVPEFELSPRELENLDWHPLRKTMHFEAGGVRYSLGFSGLDGYKIFAAGDPDRMAQALGENGIDPLEGTFGPLAGKMFAGQPVRLFDMQSAAGLFGLWRMSIDAVLTVLARQAA